MPFDGQTWKCDEIAFSLESLIAWLETQDPETYYCYASVHDCLWARYTLAMGGRITPPHNRIGCIYRLGDKTLNATPLPDMQAWVAKKSPLSYGAALQRAKAWLKDPREADRLVLGVQT